MLYVPLKGHWYIIVLNVHAPNEDRNADTKDNFYKELEEVFY